MKKLIIPLFCMFLICSCSDKEERPIGLWDDIIKLSTKNVEFGEKSDSVLITTEGDWWWIVEISLNDSIYTNYTDLNLESNSYTILEDSFVVERRDAHTLFIKLNENITGDERLMRIGLEAGDYFDSVTIKQSAN